MNGFRVIGATTLCESHLGVQQLTSLDFLSSLILSEIVGNTIYDHEVKIWPAVCSFYVDCLILSV
ncbi:hypothetical protein [Paenibacillus pseudetheri]|uniref:hypothetical protein n=1 Tax=Paenibacillus pseudetheri TaxID=2897682 RepID=UPI00311A956A